MLFSLLLACTFSSENEVQTNLRPDASFEERVEAADAAFTGTVTDIRYAQSSPGEGMVELPFTFVTWKIEKSLKGTLPETLSLRFLGGPLADGRVVMASEFPDFEVGDQDILLVDGRESGCPLVGCSQGRFRVLGDHLLTDDGNLLTISEDGAIRPGPVVEDPRLDRVKVGTTVFSVPHTPSAPMPGFLALGPSEFENQVMDASVAMSGRSLRPVISQDPSAPFFLEAPQVEGVGSPNFAEAERRLPLSTLSHK
jgi:hypothetical protein